MADKINHYEVTHSWDSKVKVGFRFSFTHKGSRHINASIAEGLSEALGVTLAEASTIGSHLKFKEI